MKVLIYGFGRMGLTHFSILNTINPKIDFKIIEPNKILRYILKENINAEFFDDDKTLSTPFDIVLITTPPALHVKILNKCLKRGDVKIFIEKPFGGHLNLKINENLSRVVVGYVLRFNPCIQWFKSNFNANDIKSIHGQYLSNSINKKPKGWRNGPFSGVSNEMGSHIIDLIIYLIGDVEMDLLSSNIKSEVSDIDDIVEARLKSKNNIIISLYFNWVKKEIRKPVFNLEIEMNDGIKYFIDQQQINKHGCSGEFLKKISVTDLSETVPYYLRGIDFTKQMGDLIADQKIIATADEALSVNKIIAKILRK